MAKLIDRLINKALLVVELPFYFAMRSFLRRALSSPEGRKKIYVQTASLFPFRRLTIFLLDQMFIEFTNHYTSKHYTDIAGFMLDLKHRAANRYFKHQSAVGNFKHCLDSVSEFRRTEQGKRIRVIADFGCGAGTLTEMLQDSFADSGLTILGFDLRGETQEYNRILRPDIGWFLIPEMANVLGAYDPDEILLVCNGVINYMSREEIQSLLNFKFGHIYWFCHTIVSDPEKFMAEKNYVLGGDEHYHHYNLPLMVAEAGYEFPYRFFPHAQSGGGYIYGISQRKSKN